MVRRELFLCTTSSPFLGFSLLSSSDLPSPSLFIRCARLRVAVFWMVLGWVDSDSCFSVGWWIFFVVVSRPLHCSSLDLTSYVLFVWKSFLCLLLFRELLALGFWCRIGGQSIFHNYTLTVLCKCSFFILFWNLISRPYAGSLVCGCD